MVLLPIKVCIHINYKNYDIKIGSDLTAIFDLQDELLTNNKLVTFSINNFSFVEVKIEVEHKPTNLLIGQFENFNELLIKYRA